MRSRALSNQTAASADASLYDRDFALWVEAQVAAIRAGNIEALDIENVVEELEGLTKRDERTLGSQLKRVMAQLLKQRYQPERASAELGAIRSRTAGSRSSTSSTKARACAEHCRGW